MTERTSTYRVERRHQDLALLVDGSPPRFVSLHGRTVTIGRDGANDVVLNDPTVSAHHCQVRDEGVGYRVLDLDSRNGTQLNGIRINSGNLLLGARLEVGRASLLCVRREDRAREDIARQQMVGSSTAMRALLADLSCFAVHDTTVLIQGESGTGKELAARAIHQLSTRRSAPFVAINCGALSKELAMSELFGHVRGAFTGANKQHSGAFERAHSGTLFLDEIGELEPSLQAALLRVLETRTLRKLGSESETSVDVRIVAATNRDLLGAIRRGAFRADLYHRLAIFRLTIPPLRDRLDDVPELAKTLLERARSHKELTPDAIEVLARYHWPGNVRELRNVLERSSALASSTIIEAKDLRFDAFDGAALQGEDQAILDIVEGHHGNVTAAARQLGMSRSTLRDRLYKIKENL